MATETIENSAEYNEKKLTEEEIKQDCERKAFVRLAEKIKKRFPRLPICIVADGLYVSEKVLKICKANRWDYIIRYKEGCAPLIRKEYEAIPEKNKAGKSEYVNEVVYRDMEIRKTQKNISSELFASFGRQLTEPEDIPAQLNDSVLN